MSHTRYEPARPRLQRSELAVPGSQPGDVRQGAGERGGLRLPRPRGRRRARPTRSRRGKNVDRRRCWSTTGAAGGKTICVRVNGIDTHYFYRDIVDVVEQAGHRLDMVLDSQGRRAGRRLPGRRPAHPDRGGQGDSAPDRHRGPDRDRARHGQRRGDRAVEPPARGDAFRRGGLRGERAGPHGEHRRAQSRLPGRPVARGAVADDRRRAAPTACGRSTARSATSRTPRAIARRPGAARRSASKGKWAIHPSQIALANEVFTPPPAEVERARRILAALDEAARDGQGRRAARRPDDRRRLARGWRRTSCRWQQRWRQVEVSARSSSTRPLP